MNKDAEWTFSWWGAYLMKEPICVVAPRYWIGWKLQEEYPVGIQRAFFSPADAS